MGEVQFRSACRADAEAVLSIKQAAIDAVEGDAYTDRQLTAWRPDDDAVSDFERGIESQQFQILLAQQAGTPVGYGGLNTVENRIDAVFVHPAHRGEGVGRSLVRQFESRARMHAIPELTIISSLNAVGFYTSLGYWDFGRKRRTINGVDLEFAIMRKMFQQ